MAFESEAFSLQQHFLLSNAYTLYLSCTASPVKGQRGGRLLYYAQPRGWVSKELIQYTPCINTTPRMQQWAMKKQI